MKTKNMIILVVLFMITIFYCVSSFEYQVGGGIKGWGVPPPNDTSFFNQWASQNRFLIGDSVRFMYKKDSVMEVGKDEYKDCNSTRPIFFSNTGNTVCQLNRSGFFYFISGVSGHCNKGQKLVVKVLENEEDYSSSHNAAGGSGGDHGHSKSAAIMFLPKLAFLLQLFLSFFASCVLY